MNDAVQQYNRKVAALNDDFYPTACHWEVTHRCNAACAYCYVPPHHGDELDEGSMLKIAEGLDEAGMISVTVSGGEPFARADILAIVERLCRGNIFWITLMTNGTLLGKREVNFIAKRSDRIRDVTISVFSHRPEINDAYFKVAGALRRQIEAATALRAAGVKITIAVNVFEFNIAELVQIEEYFSNMGLHVGFGHEKIYCERNRGCCGLHLTSKEFYLRFIPALGREVHEGFRRLFANPDTAKAASSPLCTAIRTLICVDPAGNVSPCPVLRHVRIGNFLDPRGLRRLLMDSAEYRTLRSLRGSDIPACRDCHSFGACSSCPGMNYMENGDYLKPAAQSCTFTNAIREYLKLQ